MAAPTRVQSSAGAVISATTGNTGNLAGVTVGNLIMLQIMEDGTAGDSFVSDTNSTIQTLAGLANAMTHITITPVGSPTAAWLSGYIGRATATTVNADLGVTSSNDLYVQLHEFTNVSTGTTLATVIENIGGTSDQYAVGAGTSTSVADVGVTTSGVDRLALNLVGINDDATGIAAFTGASGGTWAMPASFESATGTDGTVALMTAAMAAAGTINGGADTITSDGWGVLGFALIGTTSAAPFIQLRESQHVMQAVNRSSVY